MPPEEIMRKFAQGKLKSGSGAPVTARDQAKAIAASYRATGEESNVGEPPKLKPPKPKPMGSAPAGKVGTVPPERGRNSL